jgi:hypothetical protein
VSDVKIEDLSPVPFFAHFLEAQFSKGLTEEGMKAVRGGAAVVTMAFPSDQEGAPVGEVPDMQELIRRANELLSGLPGNPVPPNYVTTAYPSDAEAVAY